MQRKCEEISRTANISHLYDGHLFQPDELSPIHYLEIFGCKSGVEPEKRLMVAVLGEAVACLLREANGSGRRRLNEQREVIEWILEENDSWSFSFNNICEALELDPRCLRKRILQWKHLLFLL